MNKYENLLETPFKNEIILEIRKEVREKFNNIGVNELMHFSTNVYIYATLLAHKIKEQEIVNQLVYLNNIYFQDMNKDDSAETDEAINYDIEYLQYLVKKYKKIIEERI